MDSSCTVHHQYHRHHHLGRPYVYSTTIILRCFMVRMWFRLDSNRSLHQYLSIDLPCNRKVVKACGLSKLPLPSRRTFDRRLKIVSIGHQRKDNNDGKHVCFRRFGQTTYPCDRQCTYQSKRSCMAQILHGRKE